METTKDTRIDALLQGEIQPVTDIESFLVDKIRGASQNIDKLFSDLKERAQCLQKDGQTLAGMQAARDAYRIDLQDEIQNRPKLEALQEAP